MSYKRLPQSKRNELIAEFNEGKTNPDYDVIPSKSVKGKYTIRRKKPIEQEETVEEVQDQEPDEEPDEEVVTDETYNPYTDDENYFPSFKMNKNAMFREMQMQMNRMFIEQMKFLRQQTKHYERKQQKIKERTNRIHNVLQKVADNAERDDYEEPLEPVQPEEEPEEPEEKTIPSLFDSTYEDTTPKKEPEPIPEPEPLPEKQYANEYERDLDRIAGDDVQYYSRRNRLNFKNFPI